MLHGDRVTSKLMIPSNISALGLKDFPRVWFSVACYTSKAFLHFRLIIWKLKEKKHKMAATTALLHLKLSHCLQMAISRCCDYDSLLFSGEKNIRSWRMKHIFHKRRYFFTLFCNHLLLKGLLHSYIVKMLYWCACAFVEDGYMCICIIIFRLCL